MSVDDVMDVALAFFLVVAVLGLAVRAWDHDSTWLDAPQRAPVAQGSR